MNANPRAQAGFTAVELIVTLTIIGVLLALSAPGFRELTLNQGVKTAAFDMMSALQYARSEAIKRPGETVTLKAGASTDGAWSTGWRILDGSGNKIRVWTVASNITIADTSTTPVTTITFGKDGHTTLTPKLQFSSTSTVSGVGPRCVKVDLMGRPYAAMGACS